MTRQQPADQVNPGAGRINLTRVRKVLDCHESYFDQMCGATMISVRRKVYGLLWGPSALTLLRD